MYIYIYIYICTHTYTYIYIYIGNNNNSPVRFERASGRPLADGAAEIIIAPDQFSDYNSYHRCNHNSISYAAIQSHWADTECYLPFGTLLIVFD